MTVEELIGDNLRRLREAAALTQAQLEERSGVSQQYLSGLERGQRNPTMVTLLKIARALDASLLDLLAGADQLPRTSGKASTSKRQG